MGKKSKGTAVVFDEAERSNFLKGMYGSKKRRKEEYIKKKEE